MIVKELMKLFLKYREDRVPVWPIAILEEMHIEHEQEIVFGDLVLNAMIPEIVFNELQNKLSQNGFTIISEQNNILAQKIKYVVFDMLARQKLPEINISVYISNLLHLNYTYLANVFSKVEGITVERFIILKKIEKAKHLLLYYDYEVKQVALMLNYSSIGHFCNQFKKITGTTPTEYKKQSISIASK